MVTAVTHDIRVRVQAQYQPDFSQASKEQFLFSYHIHITNLGSEPVKLMSRHWYILDNFGFEREVEGPGVVGEQPEIYPNLSHTYTSSCLLNTPMGEMWGYYTFERLQDGHEFQAEIPRFQMEVPFFLN